MNKFDWRFFEAEDYPMLQKWWSEWGWPECPTLRMLPTVGIIVYDREDNLYTGFLYTTDSYIGILEFVVSNKKALPTSKRGALEYLTETIKTLAKQKKMDMLFTSTNNPAFVNSLKKTDFIIGDENMTQLIMTL